MHSTRVFRHGLQRLQRLQRPVSFFSTGPAAADVEQARKYCLNQLRTSDYDSYLVRHFVPPPARDAYDALRTLNLELARLPETVSSPAIGQLRMQFWRDAVEGVFAGGLPPREPVCLLLHRALADTDKTTAKSLRFWLLRFLDTRERHLESRPFASLAALEDYAEHTYASLLYMALAAVPVRSVHADHLASHIGKAAGIAAVLRGVPVLAAPAQKHHQQQSKSPALLLPLDIMAEAGVREEDVFRHGPAADGLQDAVFRVAVRANDHLITAREMMRNLKAGRGAGHDYEHAHEHDYPPASQADERAAADVRRAFGILLEAVPTGEYLARLEAANFDPFAVKPGGWRLPWRIWQALRRGEI